MIPFLLLGPMRKDRKREQETSQLSH